MNNRGGGEEEETEQTPNSDSPIKTTEHMNSDSSLAKMGQNPRPMLADRMGREYLRVKSEK